MSYINLISRTVVLGPTLVRGYSITGPWAKSDQQRHNYWPAEQCQILRKI